jgi:hypothetical protein
MRVMQSPWGPAVMVTAGVLAGVFAISVIWVLMALALFLTRRSRISPPPK